MGNMRRSRICSPQQTRYNEWFAMMLSRIY